jgi:hypothetical protein
MARGRRPNPDPPVQVTVCLPRSLVTELNTHFEDPFVAMLSRDGKVRRYGALSKVVCKLLRDYLNRGYLSENNAGSIPITDKEV